MSEGVALYLPTQVADPVLHRGQCAVFSIVQSLSELQPATQFVLFSNLF